jgi:6-phosphofructokinase 1
LASGQVNFTLIPEVPFQLEGKDGFLEKLHRRIQKRHHALIVVAEGAGQDLLPDELVECDASGNRQLGNIGEFLKERITAYLAERGIDTKIKYFDPSYHIRSVAANPADSLLCNKLARRAVHAAMAGKTDMLIGLRHDQFIHVPLPLVSQSDKCVDSESDLWMGVLASTAQEKW